MAHHLVAPQATRSLMAHRRGLHLLALAIAVIGGTANVAMAEQAPAEIIRPAPIVTSQNQFAFDLYAAMSRADERSSLCFSPPPLFHGLAVLREGSAGATHEQFSKVLHLADEPGATETLKPTLDLRRALERKHRPEQLRLETSLWIRSDVPIRNQYLDAVKGIGGIQVINWKPTDSPQMVLKRMESWVIDATVPEMAGALPGRLVETGTVAVMLSTSRIAIQWAQMFDPRKTRKGLFKTAEQNARILPMMNQSGQFLYHQNEHYQALAMPSADNALSFVAILPTVGQPLSKFELAPGELDKILDSLKETFLEVSFPRFELRTFHQDLIPAMKELGLVDAFTSSGADFSAMTETPGFFLHTFSQSSILELDERGARAASVVYGGGAFGSPSKPRQFAINRPFRFFIIDHTTRTILFMGRFTGL